MESKRNHHLRSSLRIFPIRTTERPLIRIPIFLVISDLPGLVPCISSSQKPSNKLDTKVSWWKLPHSGSPWISNSISRRTIPVRVGPRRFVGFFMVEQIGQSHFVCQWPSIHYLKPNLLCRLRNSSFHHNFVLPVSIYILNLNTTHGVETTRFSPIFSKL